MVIWKLLVGVFLQCVKEPTNEVDKNDNAVICTTSYFKEEVVRHMLQNISVILSVFLSLPHYPLVKCINHGSEYGLEIPAIFNFCGPEKAIKLAQK